MVMSMGNHQRNGSDRAMVVRAKPSRSITSRQTSRGSSPRSALPIYWEGCTLTLGGQSRRGADNSGDAVMTVETILRRKGTDVATIEPDASIRRAADWLCSISSMPDLTVTGALTAGKAAYAMAKLGPADIDAVELYDAFTINTILFLEDLGFCKKGEGGAF